MDHKTELASRADAAVLARAKKRRRAIAAALRRATVSQGSVAKPGGIDKGHSVQEAGR